MSNMTATHGHTVFPVSQRGDTLVVAPKGPLSQFSRSEIGVESKRIRTLLHEPDIKNLIFDLSESAYFGTAMIGAVLEFRQECVEGTTVICGLSKDMTVALDLCQLDEALPVFASRKEALSKVCHISLADQLLPKARLLRGLTVLSVLCLMVYGGWAMKLHYRVIGSPGANGYRELQAIWTDLQEPKRDLSIEQEAQRSSAAVEKITKIHVSFSRENIPKDQVYVGRAAERLKLILSGQQDDRSTRNSFKHNMHAARVGLKKRTGIEVTPITTSTDS